MKIVMIAALLAAQLTVTAPPAQAAELPSEALVAQKRDVSAESRLREEVEINLGEVRATEPRIGIGLAVAAQEEGEKSRKKRKSTGDKVLTGAAVVLGIGALAVGGLLVAIFLN